MLSKELQLQQKLIQDSQQHLDIILERCTQLKSLINLPQNPDIISWEYIGTLDKAEQDLQTLESLLRKVVKEPLRHVG